MVSFSKMLSRAPFALWAKAAGLGIDQLSSNPTVSDGLLFLSTWRKHPSKVGAILPSGPALCTAITREISAAQAPILELGCGTGVFTQKIIQQGVLPQDLILVEDDPSFAKNLHAKFPRAQVLCVDACRLYLRHIDLKNTTGAAVCGLPLRNMSIRQQFRILKGVFGLLRENGALYLFSYGWSCPITQRLLNRLNLQAHPLDTVLLNVPPARVWKLVRVKGAEPENLLQDGSSR